MTDNNFTIQGLSDEEVLTSRQQFGVNQLIYKEESGFFLVLLRVVKEPMIILLFVTAIIYFISGSIGDGIFMVTAIVLVSAISLYQDNRSRIALAKLKDFTQPFSKVIRNNKTIEIKSEDLVIGDSLVVDEGVLIAADGVITHSNDFSVNESTLTGESLAVFKDKSKADNQIYQGTSVASGLAIATVTAIGVKTKLGSIGKSLETIQDEKSPLELQINRFVKMMVFVGVSIFLVVCVVNYFNSHSFLDSLLKGLTLAMSILPEEIPVAFTTFMALGAWRLMKMGIVVKQMKTVETLGSATVICTDKTGTLTENRMSIAKVFALSTTEPSMLNADLSEAEKETIRLAMWASEPIPFDPMEKALHQAYAKLNVNDERTSFKMIHEFPLGGKPPMMTHIFQNSEGLRVIAAKGAPEAIMNVSHLTTDETERIEKVIKALTADGYRVLAVGEADFKGNLFPKSQQEFQFAFKGVVAFYDPPKENIKQVLEKFYAAGISVRIVTGDNLATTSAIANQIGFQGSEKSVTGDELMKLSEAELKKKVDETYIFARMFPEAKLKIIDSLKANNQIVAMTGDGVNDGPALKAAHIGIAMGKRGTEIAKQAASLILADDDLSRMVDAVAMGRKIYSNLKKAIQYIISIHIPIILTVLIPLILGWIYPNIFSPVHIIFLELIMGPTCSIIYENEPMEGNTMNQKPRPFSRSFFHGRELITSIVQGLIITLGTLLAYRYAVDQGWSESITRSMVFTTLIAANIILTLINRSFYYSIFTTIRYKNNLVLLIISVTIVITGMLLFIEPLAAFFAFEALTLRQLAICGAIGALSVIWYEAVKWLRRYRAEKKYSEFLQN